MRKRGRRGWEGVRVSNGVRVTSRTSVLRRLFSLLVLSRARAFGSRKVGALHRPRVVSGRGEGGRGGGERRGSERWVAASAGGSSVAGGAGAYRWAGRCRVVVVAPRASRLAGPSSSPPPRPPGGVRPPRAGLRKRGVGGVEKSRVPAALAVLALEASRLGAPSFGDPSSRPAPGDCAHGKPRKGGRGGRRDGRRERRERRPPPRPPPGTRAERARRRRRKRSGGGGSGGAGRSKANRSVARRRKAWVERGRRAQSLPLIEALCLPIDGAGRAWEQKARA